MEESRNHNVSIQNREKMTISDVQDVESFDEEKVVIETSMGMLTVFGESFRIHKLNVEDGMVTIEGVIDELKYSAHEMRREGGLFGRLFR